MFGCPSGEVALKRIQILGSRCFALLKLAGCIAKDLDLLILQEIVWISDLTGF